MTVGEKIQFYRKKIGLSQEELGQKMLLSRQTVSLWEMDKTLPTIDNLLRLKEIFSVSIDDILCEEEATEPTEKKTEQPREAYTFQYRLAELQEIEKHTFAPLVKSMVFFAVLGVLFLIFSLIKGERGALFGFIIGVLLFVLCFQIKNYLSYKKAWTQNKNTVLKNTYSYQVYKEYFVLHVSRDGDTVLERKTYFHEVEKAQSVGRSLLLHVGGMMYVLRKEVLAPDSVFFTFVQNTSHQVAVQKPKDNLKKVSNLLFVLSICTIWGALAVVAFLSERNRMMVENMWAFFLFLPVPIASIAFGLYLKKRRYTYKKNIIVGVVMAILLSIYGSFTFIFANVYTHGDEPILRAEQMLALDIPPHAHINTQDWTQNSQSFSGGYIYSSSEIYFDADAVIAFERSLPNNEKWLSQIPNDLIGITSYFFDMQTGDYRLIYNQDTKQFNELPEHSGTYRFLNILYDADSHTMKLVEYQIVYTK